MASFRSAGVTTVPGAPRSPKATPGDRQVTVSWTAPSSNGGSAITGYRVQRATNGTNWATVSTRPATARSFTVTGLTNRTAYQFRVRAVSAIGLGAASAVVTATPRTVPGVPRSPEAFPGNEAVTVTWINPATNGGSLITGYRVQRSRNNTNWTTLATTAPSARSYVATGLFNGTNYQFRVIALNAAGAGAPSAVVAATPRPLPSAPLSPAVQPGDQRAIVRWATPAGTGGSPITAYRVQQSTNGRDWTTVATRPATARSSILNGLTNGANHQFRVRAVNATGEGPPSAGVSAVPRSRPAAPGSLRAVPGDRRVTLWWTRPPSDGGSAITAYRIQRSTNGRDWTYAATRPGSASSVITTGLVNGTTYRFRVVAVNALGNSAPSAVAPASPRTVPSAPRSTRSSVGNRRVTVAWAPPATTGGSAITGHRVQRSTNGRNWTTVATRPATSRSVTMHGLANGTTYQFRVRALNAAGAGSPSPMVAARPRP
jgi:titin